MSNINCWKNFCWRPASAIVRAGGNGWSYSSMGRGKSQTMDNVNKMNS